MEMQVNRSTTTTGVWLVTENAPIVSLQCISLTSQDILCLTGLYKITRYSAYMQKCALQTLQQLQQNMEMFIQNNLLCLQPVFCFRRTHHFIRPNVTIFQILLMWHLWTLQQPPLPQFWNSQYHTISSVPLNLTTVVIHIMIFQSLR